MISTVKTTPENQSDTAPQTNRILNNAKTAVEPLASAYAVGTPDNDAQPPSSFATVKPDSKENAKKEKEKDDLAQSHLSKNADMHTALDIGTITPEEAAKYSFLKDKGAKVPTPSKIVMSSLESTIKDIDIFGSKTEKHEVDMKKLHKYFAGLEEKHKNEKRGPGSGKDRRLSRKDIKEPKEAVVRTRHTSKSHDKKAKKIQGSDRKQGILKALFGGRSDDKEKAAPTTKKKEKQKPSEPI